LPNSTSLIPRRIEEATGGMSKVKISSSSRSPPVPVISLPPPPPAVCTPAPRLSKTIDPVDPGASGSNGIESSTCVRAVIVTGAGLPPVSFGT
jgi:hypothetical protein